MFGDVAGALHVFAGMLCMTVLMELPHALVMLGDGLGFVIGNDLHVHSVCGSAGAILVA